MTEHYDVETLASTGTSVVVSRRGLLTAGAALASLTAVGAVPAAVAAAADPPGVIYAINRSSKDLIWYRHEGRNNGTGSWANNGRGRRVGTGWDFEHVFWTVPRPHPPRASPRRDSLR
ncbi:hypothetical protein GCM10011374_30150 [Kocuria dechangensis]|uniref:Tachylectin n=1 Tax=Kocuria dechangensis TaxID=1176249 RepID=A0A917H1G3_9MICC|nr:tachylectin-related carbohydrate-binding protein [Kocuria dechangensis]GGG64499.1 hypothetical protein GCM10011374_30150 [Kocuria dechangensis]